MPPAAHRSSHHSRFRRLIFALLLVPLLTGALGTAPLAPPVSGDELADARAQQQALERKIAEQKKLVAQLSSSQASLQAKISSTTRELKGITANLEATRKRVDNLAKEIERVQGVYEQLVVELEDLNTDLERIEAEEAAKRVELRDRKEQLAQRIRDAYEAERTSFLEVVLSGDTFTDVLAEMSYQLDVAEQDKALAEQIARDRETLAALGRTVLLTRDQTNLMREETAAQKRQLDQRLAELKEAQAQLKVLERETKRALASQKAAYEKLAADKARLKKVIAETEAAKKRLQKKIDSLIRKQYEMGNIPSQYNGTFIWPMRGTVSGEFGCSPFPFYGPGYGCAHFHNGIDIVAPYGTPIKAAGPGRVVYVGWNYADGANPAWIVIIAHASNLSTWYAHMIGNKYPGGIRAGSYVKQGQIIGYEGATGRVTGAHLHWMVQLDGLWVNPRRFV
jgi:murein DD-endopeptidase MepM/ murein hydrolase activator NlpD